MHLCHQVDVRLRPRQRDERSAIRLVSVAEHNRAFLEHHCHAVAIVEYLVSKYADTSMDLSCGFSVTVYPRFDGDVINPEHDMLIMNRSHDAARPCVSLLLYYNNTGEGTTGYHYDPALPAQPRKRQRETISDMVESQTPPLLRSRPTPTKKQLCAVKPKSKATPRPQKATFLSVEDPFSQKCQSSICGGDCQVKEKVQNMSGLNESGYEENENQELDVFQEEEYNGFIF